ncbi:MAG: 50S ribosomal protein L25 [Candidatus Omnitrophota bacterium]
MERVEIKVDKRDKIGKEGVKKLRKQGFVPAVVYSEDTNIVLTIPFAGLKTLQAIHFSESTVIDMEIAGQKNKSLPVLIKAVQYHPLTEEIIHIDFLKVSLKEKIKVHIPIVLKGEPKGVKEEGGVLEQILRELEIEGLPLNIPEKAEIDVSELVIGHSLHVSDLTVPGDITIVTDMQTLIVTALAKQEEPEEEVPVETEAAAEPEVIKEKKEAEGEEPAKKEEKKKSKD